nr:hypothetical protein [Tanacetum cinerariifolium]
PNGDALRKCILSGAYKPTTVVVQDVDATDDSPTIPEHTTKNLALIAKYFKKIYKPTNNNLKTSLNSRNKNVDTTPRYKNDNQSRQFRNQRTMNVAGARENECRKPKRVKDSAYHKEKMLLCGDFKRLRIQDIKDMLLLLVQGKLTNLTVEECFAFNVSLRMFTRSIVIHRCVENLQLGVKSYQKKLNLTKPDTYRSDLKRNDGTLNDVRTALDDRLKGIRMKYLPRLSGEKVTRKEQQQ